MEEGGKKPGWRDFERVFALAFGGKPTESKALFDVLIPHPDQAGVFFGASCKMKKWLDRIADKKHAYLEMSNAAGEFWRSLGRAGVTESNYRDNPDRTGEVVLEALKSWKQSRSIESGGDVDLSGSYYFALQWSSKRGLYQLFQFSMDLPPASSLRWYVPPDSVRTGKEARSVRADDASGPLIEWYPRSGGQLKYFPRVENAIWNSEPFKLEPLPDDLPNVLTTKARAYFPDMWASAEEG